MAAHILVVLPCIALLLCYHMGETLVCLLDMHIVYSGHFVTLFCKGCNHSVSTCSLGMARLTCCQYIHSCTGFC